MQRKPYALRPCAARFSSRNGCDLSKIAEIMEHLRITSPLIEPRSGYPMDFERNLSGLEIFVRVFLKSLAGHFYQSVGRGQIEFGPGQSVAIFPGSLSVHAHR